MFRRQSSMYRLMGLLVLITAILASVAPTSAKPDKPATNPHTIVSNDGTTPDANMAGIVADSSGAMSLPTEGTGEQAKGQRPVNDADIAPAAQGDQVGVESIIGTDSRYQITNTTAYPYRAIAKITSSIGGCTGWLINANTVATAGHCLHNGSWASNVVVYPGRNGTSSPYGSCTAARLYSVTGWTSSRSPEYDYGAIKLNCSIGNTTGWFGYRWTSASLTGEASYISGYPGDKPSGTQWRSDDSIRSTATRRLYYANDTYGGHSGSPVWNNNAGCSTCGIAIHAYGVGSNGYNGGTRITQEVFNNLTTWKNS